MNPIVYATVMRFSQHLTDDELAALALAIQLGNKSIDKVVGYDKVAPLWKDSVMHQEIRKAFLAYAYQGLGE